MRVITGSARGRKLKTLAGDEIVRPTAERVKEALFSIVQFELEDAAVLDAFAGSSALRRSAAGLQGRSLRMRIGRPWTPCVRICSIRALRIAPLFCKRMFFPTCTVRVKGLTFCFLIRLTVKVRLKRSCRSLNAAANRALSLYVRLRRE